MNDLTSKKEPTLSEYILAMAENGELDLTSGNLEKFQKDPTPEWLVEPTRMDEEFKRDLLERLGLEHDLDLLCELADKALPLLPDWRESMPWLLEKQQDKCCCGFCNKIDEASRKAKESTLKFGPAFICLKCGHRDVPSVTKCPECENDLQRTTPTSE